MLLLPMAEWASFSISDFMSWGDKMSAKSKVTKAVKKTEADLSKVGIEAGKEIKRGGSALKADAKKLRKKV